MLPKFLRDRNCRLDVTVTLWARVQKPPMIFDNRAFWSYFSNRLSVRMQLPKKGAPCPSPRRVIANIPRLRSRC